MSEIVLASSALIAEEFEGKRTIEEAQKAGFDGVQLFLDPRYREEGYADTVIDTLKASGLKLILHLPNTVEEADIRVAERIVTQFPTAKVLIHYIPTTELPKVQGTKVGWENSRVSPLDEEQLAHLAAVRQKVQDDDTFYVFDMGRPLYAATPEDQKRTIQHIKDEIAKLDPTKDVIHLADKSDWVMKFRDCMCVLGEGVMREFMDDIRAFSGPVVFEHENLQMALDSLKVLKGE